MVHAGEGAETTVLPCVVCTVPECTGVSTGTTGRTGLYRVDTGLFPLRHCCERQCYGSGRALAESYYRQTLSLAILVARYQAIESIPAFLEEDADGGAGLIA